MRVDVRRGLREEAQGVERGEAVCTDEELLHQDALVEELVEDLFLETNGFTFISF